ncbi:MAG: enoyl-CoA hydratase/isomerase family protein [Deltaproteobacteria bacterium]|jgi:enoyl-CoA hydratase|nr:enoyl-CoA hydratase/isomerase family protein [Deltaproteobacteria bacterium]MBW2480684.1 enoyl-CoA hydratase/isomerase family protein [Deltaproteobacteria bacterium]
MTNKTVRYERTDNVAIITLNRPERLNAITRELLAGLIDQLETARKDDEVAAVILTGAGRAFCAGEDLKETSAGKTFEQWVEETDGLQQVQRVILGLGKPLIAAIPGYALGGGCEFALSCDIRIAAEEAQFGFPETEVGLTITTAGTKLLSQIVGLGKAKELVFTGDFVDAREALRIGLANQVVAQENLLEAALALARKISEKSPLALKLSRIAIDQGLHSSFEQTLELEASHLLTCVAARNQERFVASKLQKMKPTS